MTDKIDTTPEAVSQHLDISHNHEAGLIPMSTQTMMHAMSARIAELEYNNILLLAELDDLIKGCTSLGVSGGNIPQALELIAKVKALNNS